VAKATAKLGLDKYPDNRNYAVFYGPELCENLKRGPGKNAVRLTALNFHVPPPTGKDENCYINLINKLRSGEAGLYLYCV
jgi:hypothetical protein